MNTNMKDAICEALNAGRALDLFTLAEQLDMDAGILQATLNELCAEGRAAITRKGKYALPEQLGILAARASALRNGTPVARPLSDGPALKIVRTRLSPMPDDLLLIRPTDDETCELVSILQRGRTDLAAFIRIEQREIRRPRNRHDHTTPNERRRIVTGVPCDRRIPYSIEITGEVVAANDDIALLSIDRYPEGDRPILAHIVRVLGRKSDMQARLKVIAETHDFPTEFPASVESQCSSLMESAPEMPIARREDHRQLLTFTIDGAFSKDFDDAVSLERTPEGDWLLGVHIADVSHYVRPGSAIDREAFARGTSLYLPGLTVPMLPEILSNDLCSLMPDVDRLTLSCFMIVRDGRVVDHHLCRSIIHSHARLTYDAVNRLFDGDDDAVDSSLHDTLRDMLALSHQLRNRRFASGCIELDLPETEFILNEENVPTDIVSASRGEAERLIEDFMLAANETVARLAQTTGTPLVYRVHENPDSSRLSELERFLANQNIRAHFGPNPHPGVLQKVLEDVKDHPNRDAIRRMLLRSLQRAQYSERPLGHYALALDDYCHFTSPIRRYPDLIVHRMMKHLMDASTDSSAERMQEFARQSSVREQESVLAEREADALLKARYMQDHIGQEFDGIVSSITSWGLYVMLDNTAEGLVHIASLDDYYEFDRERSQLVAAGSRNVFRLGNRVRIRVESVDIDRAEVNFVLVPVR